MASNDSPFSIGINNFPPHLYVPSDADSLDARAAALVSSGGGEELLLTYIVPQGKQTVIFGYSLYNDGLLESSTKFLPRIDGYRTLKNHGRPVYVGNTSQPQANFIMSLGLGPNLSNVNLIQCNIVLKELQQFTWHFQNDSGVGVNAGVRIVGYEFSGASYGAKSGS
jgi:hypothetical protein